MNRRSFLGQILKGAAVAAVGSQVVKASEQDEGDVIRAKSAEYARTGVAAYDSAGHIYTRLVAGERLSTGDLVALSPAYTALRAEHSDALFGIACQDTARGDYLWVRSR